MTVDNNNAAANEAARRAAAEAAAREAARRAAEEAARQAAAQQAKQPEPAAPTQPKMVPDKAEGFWGDLKEKIVEQAHGKATPEQTSADRAALEQDFQAAKTPADLAKLHERAKVLAQRADVSDDPGVQSQVAAIRKLTDQIARADDAAKKLEQLESDLASGDPTVRANAMAAMMSRPKELTDPIEAFGPLAGSPLGQDFKARSEAIARQATPATLASQLAAEPDLSKYPPDMAKNLLALRVLQDPALDEALDEVGETLLRDANDGKGDNPLSYDALKQHPELVRLIAPLAETHKAEFEKVVAGWGKSILDQALDGKQGKDEVEQALETFQEEMLGLAGMGLDPTVVAHATAETLEDNKGRIQDKAEDGGGVLGFFKDAAGWVADKIGGLIDFVKDKVEDVAKKAAEVFYDHVVDPALDHSALGEDTDTFKGENTGILGDLVTNRLEIGESAFIRLDVNAKIAGVALGAGAQLELKRVPKLGENGEPLPPVNGVPQTELQVKVLADANAGVGLEAKFGKAMGKDTAIKGHEKTAGGEVGGGVSAEAGVKGQAELVFSFDATSEQAMEDMTGLFKECAETGLKAAIPGIGPVLAAANAPEAAEAALAFGRHLETVRVEAGVYANASVEANANVGMVDRPEAANPAGGAAPAGPAEGGEANESKSEQAKKAAAGALLDRANLDLASVQAAVGGELGVGMERNFKTGETTIYLHAKGEAKAQAGVVGANAGAAAEYDRQIAVTLDKDGQIKELTISEAHSKEKFEGLGQTDIMGRIDDGVLAQVSNESTITVTRRYKDLSDFENKSPTEIAAQLLKDAHSDTNPNLAIADIKASETDKFELGAEIAGVGVKLTLGRTLETDVEQAAWNETRKAEAGR